MVTYLLLESQVKDRIGGTRYIRQSDSKGLLGLPFESL